MCSDVKWQTYTILRHFLICSHFCVCHLDVACGWDKETEVVVFEYWLAHGASYTIVSAAFDIPRSIIHNTHRMLLRQTIHLPRGDQFEKVGTRFSHLAGFTVLNVVGWAKPPCYLNRRQFAYSCRPSVTIRAGFGTLLLDSQAEYGILLCWITCPDYFRWLYPWEGR